MQRLVLISLIVIFVVAGSTDGSTALRTLYIVRGIW